MPADAARDAICLTAGPVRVQFTRHADRFGHAVAVSAGSAWQTLLRSVEGPPDEDWPPSPPLQELHVEQRADRVVLAVGQAGAAHWSLSAAALASGRAITLDLACRLRHGKGPLRSTYDCQPGAQVQALPDGALIQAAGRS